jgi:thymidylate synthase (FAD)
MASPKIFVLATSQVDKDALQLALNHLGVSNWSTDAASDAELLTEFAGKVCYMSFDKSLNRNLTKTGGRSNHKYIQDGIIAKHHGSVLEHSTVTLLLADVSRVLTHELVRHRAGVAVSQTSGRYVRNDLKFFVPKCIADNPKAAELFMNAATNQETAVHELEKVLDIDNQPFEKKKEMTSAIRRIVGNGSANNIIITANHRAWRHMISMRTAPGAEEEIRSVFRDVFLSLRNKFPAIYDDGFCTEDGAIHFAHEKV